MPSRGSTGHAPDRQDTQRQTDLSRLTPRDSQLTARIQERAYFLFEAGGRQHGHDLEYWLEAERQVTGLAAGGEKKSNQQGART